MNTNKAKITTWKTKKMSNTDPAKNQGWTQGLVKGRQLLTYSGSVLEHASLYNEME